MRIPRFDVSAATIIIWCDIAYAFMNHWRYLCRCGALTECGAQRQHQSSECEDQASHDRGRLNDIYRFLGLTSHSVRTARPFEKKAPMFHQANLAKTSSKRNNKTEALKSTRKICAIAGESQ